MAKMRKYIAVHNNPGIDCKVVQDNWRKLAKVESATWVRTYINEKKGKVQIFVWIENMRGYLCQHCNQRQEMFSSGSVGRAIFLLEIPFLGRIPIDLDLAESADFGAPFLEKYPKSEVAESCNLIIKAIMEKNFEVNQSKSYNL